MLRYLVFTTLNLVGTVTMLKMIVIVILLTVFQGTYMHACYAIYVAIWDVHVELVAMRSYCYKN